MKYLYLIVLIVIFLIQCNSPKKTLVEILNGKYDQHFISSGDNFPQISLYKNERYKFLIGLHNGFNKNEIKEVLNWTDSTLIEEIEILKENEYLKETDGILYPSISIIMQNEGKDIYKHTQKTAEEVASSIIEIEPDIKQLYENMEIASRHEYEKLAFFILSDVLLDNWQINNVEKLYLKKERPLKHGKRYYIQFAEKDTLKEREVFGIYGNQYSCKDTLCFITYGNNRKNHHMSFEKLLLTDIPLLSISDQVVLDKMADSFTQKLIKILTKNHDKFVSYYNNSIAKKEISYEEFFIWYYHFLYTKTTDILAQRGHIAIPESGIFRIKLQQ